MRYFCETNMENIKHFFISREKPCNSKIISYKLRDDNYQIIDLEKSIDIFNSSNLKLSAQNLLYIYMILSDLCIEDVAKNKFNEMATRIASEQIQSLYV